ncbi:MAG: T9SS type A sorting domain-containing protein [Saprospiraceae bacterium]|nr:T9SS type A sorting domain-containing protein [Saprospiraceae bacterium]
MNFPYPVGTYTVCASGSNFFLSCFPWAEKCTTIEVVEYPIPAGYETGYVCTNDTYVAGNGEEFYYGGVFNLLYHTWQGCDSIVVLTLTQKISDFKVTVKEVCAGECVEWGGETVCETGTYDEVLQNQFGCDSTNQLLLISVPIETQINGADTIDCVTTSVTLTSVGSIYAANPVYIWKKGNTVVGNGTTLNVTTGGTYTLQINSIVAGKTCTDIATVLIVQNTTQPQGVVATGGNVTCTSPQVTLLGNSTTQGVSYHWNGPNGFTSNQQNPTVSAQGNYVLTVTGTNGCTKSATAVVSENKVPPTATATTNGTINCNASSVLLSGAGSSTGSQFTYLWTTANGNILSNETTLTPTVNQAGLYVLTVTNTTNGCTKTASTAVIQLPPVTSQITGTTNVACFGETSGSASIAAAGGNGNFTYAWSNGQTGAMTTNLLAGNYTVVVTDGNGCTSSQSVVIAQPPSLVVNASATPQTIFNVNNGTATANPTGGVGSFTYLWSNGGTTQTITDLAPDNYTVVVTDGNGCTASQTVTVSANNCIVKANIDQTNVSCPGAADGSATINLENANPPFTFLWSNGAATQTVTGLAGGTYDVSATDANGCEVVSTVIIEEPLQFNANATATDQTAYNANDGTASATPTDGTAPYSFLWENGETTETIGGLAPGDYSVVVTDANGCESEQTVTVNPFNCGLSANIIVSNISCSGASNGQATISLVGGTAPFTYNWSNGETTATITDLPAGTYIATATDESGCPAIAEVTLVEPNPLGLDIVEEVEAECNAADGSLTISGTDGTPGYSYLWQSGETTPTITGLTAGTYTVAITDANNCIDNFDIQLGTNDNVPPVVAAQNITVILDANGQATAAPGDVDNGSTDDCDIASINLDQTNFNCDDLGDNTVTLSVTDIGNNTATATATVTVVDNSAPVLVLQNVTLNIGTNGTATLTPQLVDNGSSDNCGIVEWTFSQASFGCNDAGPQTVEVTATDASGNSTTSTVMVMVTENTPPAINCPGNMVLPYCDPVADFNVTATDNCAGAVTLTQTSGTPSGSTYPTGNTTVAFTATDVSGNTANCSFVINVPPTMTVGTSTVDVTCNGENDGSATATPTGGSQPYAYQWSSGDDTQSANGLEAGQYTVSVTDAGGCTVVQDATVDEPSDLTTLLVDIINATNNGLNGSVDVSVNGGTPSYTYLWKNAAGQTIGNTQDIAGLGAGTYSLLVTDANGCQSQSAYTIQNVNAVDETDTEGRILLYPNPTSGWVTLELTGPTNLGTVEISAFDVTGRLVLAQQGHGNQLKMNFTDKPSAVYFIKVVVGNDSFIKRLVVNK